MKTIKLIYDKFDNEIGFIQNEIDDNSVICIDDVLKNLPNNPLINRNRLLLINTWGIKKMDGVKCDIVFDLRNFQTKLDIHLDVHSLNGFSKEIQDSIILHPKFLELIDKVVSVIEQDNPMSIGFFCNHGKHRSVGWAELIKKYYYNKAKVKHLCRPQR